MHAVGSTAYQDEHIAARDHHRQVAERLEVLYVDEARVAVMHDERMQTSSEVLRRRALVRDERVVARDAEELVVVPLAVVGAQGRELPLERALGVCCARYSLHVQLALERVEGVFGRLPTPLDANDIVNKAYSNCARSTARGGPS